MKKVRYLFRHVHERSGWASRIIGWWGKLFNSKLKYLPDFSHGELEFCHRWWWGDSILPKTIPFPYDDFGNYKGVCFSSARKSYRGAAYTGVRFAPSYEVLEYPENFYAIDMYLTDEQEQLIFDKAVSILGAGYDWVAIFGFAFPRKIAPQSSKWWFCAECINWILSFVPEVSGLDKIYRWSPVATAGLMIEKFGYMYNAKTNERIYYTIKTISDVNLLPPD
jgi:hypothetical protein